MRPTCLSSFDSVCHRTSKWKRRCDGFNGFKAAKGKRRHANALRLNQRQQQRTTASHTAAHEGQRSLPNHWPQATNKQKKQQQQQAKKKATDDNEGSQCSTSCRCGSRLALLQIPTTESTHTNPRRKTPNHTGKISRPFTSCQSDSRFALRSTCTKAPAASDSTDNSPAFEMPHSCSHEQSPHRPPSQHQENASAKAVQATPRGQR